MSCPKCGFDEPGSRAESCGRCGVVFAKFGKERPERPRTARRLAPPPPPEQSLLSRSANLLLLGVGAIAATVMGLQWYEGRAPSPPPAESAGVPAAGTDSTETGSSSSDASGAPPSAEPALLVIPGLETRPEGPGEAPEVAKEIPQLPPLSEATATPALLERAKSVARDHPNVSWVEQYVIATHLLLAGRAIRERRFREALRFLDQSEEWGAPEGEVAAFRALVYDKEGVRALAEQWARTAIAYGSRANPAEMHHIIGKAHYFREEMGKAIEEFEKALSIRDDPTIRASLARAKREAEASEGFERQRLSHFIVRYEGETMEGTGRMVIDTMERSYASLVSQLGFEPEEPVAVILYSRRSFREMGGPHWSAGLFDGKIRIPVRGLERLDQHIKSTLHHELAHAFIHDRAGKAAPRWLHEGLAEYVEGTRANQSGKDLARLLNDGNSFEACLSAARCDVRVFYPAAASMVDYVIQNRGLGGIRDILTHLGEGEDIDGALQRVMGRDELGLIGDWEHFIKRRYS